MPASKVDYALEYEACEQEDIRTTGRVQPGLRLFACTADGPAWASENLDFDPAALSAALRAATARPLINDVYALVETATFGRWLHHRVGDTDIYEQPVVASDTPEPPGPHWDQLVAQSRQNVFKFAHLTCQSLKGITGAERVMVYRFHPDWSGEVIAEAVEVDLDPYMGLHYPPTDIPQQARTLYQATKSRHIFSTRTAETPLVALRAGAPPLDLSHALGRSVSPYHIEYLRNMGSDSTASCALMVEGRLWGLIALHYNKARLPRLAEFQLIQNTAREASSCLEALIVNQDSQADRRSQRLQNRFIEQLDAYSDPFRTLLLSDVSAHRMLNGHGASLLLGRRLANAGKVPASEIVQALAQHYGADLAEGRTAFVEELPDAIPAEGRRSIAGCTITRLSADFDAFLLIYRTELNQTVNWGGDPRRKDQNGGDRRFTPRQSFKLWVERVEGRCAPWTARDRELLARMIGALTRHFDVTPSELTLLVRNGFRQALKRRERVRDSALDSIDGIQTAIAVGVEDAGEGDARIIALNRSASEAFSVSQAETGKLNTTELEAITGVDLSCGVEQSFTATITTTNQGVRECEVSIGLLFEAIDLDQVERPYRVQVYEFRDVTEAKRIEAALQAARDRAIQDARLRSEFFAKLGHELKTPLNGLIGLSELLIRFEKDKLPEGVVKKLTLLQDTSKHMATLVNATLENASAIQYVDATTFERIELRALVQEAVDLLAATVSENDVQLRIDGDDNAAGFSDPRGLRQVLINVISNAIKYNVPGGLVTVGIKARDGDFMLVEIGDTGRGMTAEQVERCMTPYTRFSNGEGSGLGLSIANNLMEMMGGTIQIRSVEGEGTHVELMIPSEPARFESAVRA